MQARVSAARAGAAIEEIHTNQRIAASHTYGSIGVQGSQE
jgi:hypothetical protein